MEVPKNKAGIPNTLKVLKGFSGSRNKKADLPLEVGNLVTLQAFKILTDYDDQKINGLIEQGYLIEASKEDIVSRDIIDAHTVEQRIKEKEKTAEQKVIEILKKPDLLDLIDHEFNKKIEGELQARKAIFLTFNMHNVANLSKSTDNLMTNDDGGTGKDYVVSAVFDIIPDKEKEKRVRISPKVLAYLNDFKDNPNGWIKKCLYLEDVPNEVLNDDGFKVMCSADPNGITQTSIIVNNAIKNIDIRGKPSIVITIAQANPKQEILRRFPICNLTSTNEQTRTILRKTAQFAIEGESPEYDPAIKKALEYLKRIKVNIPFASKIGEIFPVENVIIRTHFPRFLDYIKSSCALHQYQREQNEKGNYLATGQDYDIAREVMSVTTSNVLMIPHTKLQKEILLKFEELERKSYIFQDLSVSMQKLANERWLRIQLDRLVEQGFLERGNEKLDDGIKRIKPLATYKLKGLLQLRLPSFQELENSSYNTHNTYNTINTNHSNKEIKGFPSNLNDLHVMNGEFEPNGYKLLLSLLNQNGKPELEIQELIDLGISENDIDYAKQQGCCFEVRGGVIKGL